MNVIGAVTIGKLIEAHYEKDEHKFNAYAEFIAEAYKERGEERAERIIRSKIDRSYKNKPVSVTLDKEIKEKMKRDCSTCICKEGSCYPSTTIFDKDKTCKSYEPDYEGYIAELEKKNTALRQDWEIMKNTISEYNDFCDKYISLEKENAELKHIIATLRQEKDNVSMHAKAMEVVAKTRSDQLTKAKEIIKDLLGSENTSCEEEMFFEIRQKAEQFLSEVENV